MLGESSFTLPQKIDRFEIHRCLGKGAQGLVLLGRDSALEREVALKLMTGLSGRITSLMCDLAKARSPERFITRTLSRCMNTGNLANSRISFLNTLRAVRSISV